VAYVLLAIGGSTQSRLSFTAGADSSGFSKSQEMNVQVRVQRGLIHEPE
jgi:hypothetical protein